MHDRFPCSKANSAHDLAFCNPNALNALFSSAAFFKSRVPATTDLVWPSCTVLLLRYNRTRKMALLRVHLEIPRGSLRICCSCSRLRKPFHCTTKSAASASVDEHPKSINWPLRRTLARHINVAVAHARSTYTHL